RELIEMSTKIVLLDRVLAHYGPEAKQARDLLRTSVSSLLDHVWGSGSARSSKFGLTGEGEVIYDSIQELSPHDDIQRSLQNQALSVAIDVGQPRLLMMEQGSATVSIPLLLVVVFSLSISFASFSLHASPNPTVIASLILCGLAVAGVLFLIMEMYTPFQGLI